VAGLEQRPAQRLPSAGRPECAPGGRGAEPAGGKQSHGLRKLAAAESTRGSLGEPAAAITRARPSVWPTSPCADHWMTGAPDVVGLLLQQIDLVLSQPP
jgi:hypothetical protein